MNLLEYFYLFTGLFLTWRLFTAAYNVFLHPLRKYPGPTLDAATRLVYVYHMIIGDSCKYLARLHDKYGEVVRVGPNELSYTTASANKVIFGTKATADTSFEKNPAVYIQGSGMAQNILFASTSEHPRYRRLMGPAFSEQAMREQEPMIQEFTSTMIETFRHNRSGEAYYPSKDGIVNIGAWSIFVTFDVFSALSFGEPIGCIATADYHPWAHVIFGAMKHATFLQCAHRLRPYHRILEKLIPREISAPMEEHMEYSRAFMEKTEKDEKFSRASFSSFILKGMTKDELFDNINILATAGSETTATAISSIFYYLTHKSDSYQKLVDEVRSAFTSEEEITFNSMANLKYLNAVIKETLRIHPSVPVGLHRITPKAGSYIDGQWVPGGTWVSVALLAAYRSPRYWHRAEEFIPERWLGDPEFASDNRAIWAPWSIGPRKCIGINLAYLNMRLITVRLLWNFDFEAQPDNLDPHELHEFGVWQGQAPLNLKIRDARTSVSV